MSTTKPEMAEALGALNTALKNDARDPNQDPARRADSAVEAMKLAASRGSALAQHADARRAAEVQPAADPAPALAKHEYLRSPDEHRAVLAHLQAQNPMRAAEYTLRFAGAIYTTPKR